MPRRRRRSRSRPARPSHRVLREGGGLHLGGGRPGERFFPGVAVDAGARRARGSGRGARGPGGGEDGSAIEAGKHESARSKDASGLSDGAGDPHVSPGRCGWSVRSRVKAVTGATVSCRCASPMSRPRTGRVRGSLVRAVPVRPTREPDRRAEETASAPPFCARRDPGPFDPADRGLPATSDRSLLVSVGVQIASRYVSLVPVWPAAKRFPGTWRTPTGLLLVHVKAQWLSLGQIVRDLRLAHLATWPPPSTLTLARIFPNSCGSVMGQREPTTPAASRCRRRSSCPEW